jgi:hypothetical protein
MEAVASSKTSDLSTKRQGITSNKTIMLNDTLGLKILFFLSDREQNIIDL